MTVFFEKALLLLSVYGVMLLATNGVNCLHGMHNLPEKAVEELGLKITMRDGKELMDDVLLPSREGKFPTIFIHTPHKRDGW